MRTLFILVLIFITVSVSAQSISAVYINKQQNTEGMAPTQFHLISTISESLFYNSEIENEYFESEAKDSYGLPKTFEIRLAAKQNYIYKSFKKDELIEVIADFKENYYDIHDSLHVMKWDISSEKKEISGFLCTKATTHFRGRNYEAWFTSEVPFRTGPWKLGGLPGLIFEAREENGLIEYTLQKLTISKKEVDIALPDFEKEPITAQAYLKKYLDQMEEYFAFKEAQLRKMGSDVKIRINRSAFEPLEIYSH